MPDTTIKTSPQISNQEKQAPPTTMVIFGATGDLSRKKLLPALYRLKTLGMLSPDFNIIGYATRKLTDEGFADFARKAIEEFSNHNIHGHEPIDEEALDELLSGARFVSASFDDKAGFSALFEKLAQIDATQAKSGGAPLVKIFYLATPPTFFRTIIEQLDRAGGPGPGQRATDAGHCAPDVQTGLHTDAQGKTQTDSGLAPLPRIIIEKPFGRDITTARKLNTLLAKHFREEQVYRIDHYLGKETVQNLLFFRFANGIYEPIWNRRYIDHVQITVAEKDGVGSRGKYFEESGTLRDMVQNHILQLLALFAMEPPNNMEADTIQRKKIELIESLRPISADEVREMTVRGQYGAGVVDGETHRMYRTEKYVSPDSTVETFVALKLFIDNWRWSDVPFYIRTGKALKTRATEIAIHFKAVPHCLFTESETGCPQNNVLELKIQPDEGIRFSFNIKLPGSVDKMDTVEMDFSYKENYSVELPEAYERLLYDCMVGDSTLFPHRDAIEASWEFITGILNGWETLDPGCFPNYSPGSFGPKEADELIQRDGREWREP